MVFHKNILFIIFPILTSCGPQNYDECMLKEMKGQTVSMRSTADRICEKEHPYEKKLSNYENQIEISWSSGLHELNLEILKNRGDYRITKYKASFSNKSCSEITSYADYISQREFTFSKWNTKTKIIDKDIEYSYFCMRTDEIIGIRK